MGVLAAEDLRIAKEITNRYPNARSAMMPLLYLVQSVEGYVSPDGMREVAEILGVKTSEVEAVASFYTMFRLKPAGKYVLSICTNLSCQVRGADKLYEKARELLGEEAEEVTSDGLITLHEEECLGACDAAPVVQINFVNYDDVTEDELAQMIDGLRREDPPRPSRGPVPKDLKAASRTLAGLGGEA